MTLTQARNQLYRAMQKNSELDPTTVDGAALLDTFINRAYKELLLWKTPQGRLYFPVGRGSTVFQLKTYTGTATSGTSTTITIPTSGLVTTDDYYIEWMIKTTGGTGSGQARVIVDWVGSTGVATVHKAWDTTPSSDTTFLLTKRFVQIVDSSDTGSVDGILLDPETTWQGALKLTDLVDGADLERAERAEGFSGNLATTGVATQFYPFGERLYFDFAPAADRWIKLEYAKLPADLSAASDELQLPVPWDGWVVLRAKWWFLMDYGETEEAYSVDRYITALSQRFALPGEDLGDRTPGTVGRLP